MLQATANAGQIGRLFLGKHDPTEQESFEQNNGIEQLMAMNSIV